MERWLIAYDVQNNKRRRNVALTLENFGDRIQYSVFEVILRNDDLDILQNKIQNIIKPAEDNVRFYPACNACAEKVINVGLDKPKPWEEPDFIVV